MSSVIDDFRSGIGHQASRCTIDGDHQRPMTKVCEPNRSNRALSR
jgi:hypothetical protein